ncbi:MAG: hypothetical protein IJS53_00655, partial [Clostridia bacterium]|nr:hypothetical protein [Clostridia bacterium]
MKKLLALLLAMMMIFSIVPAFAEGEAAEGDSAGSAGSEGSEGVPVDNTERDYLCTPCDFALIEADEATGQVRLTYDPATTTILEVDGLKFKDLNKNGELDVYEDWRKEIEERVWDLIAQLEPLEEAGLHFCTQPDLNNARNTVKEYKNNCILFNLNGDPVTIINNLNHIQAACEAERLGIPMTFASDREYNVFGGYIDKAHVAFGTANDPELAYKLAYIYGTGMMAVGIHVTFEPYANEIGAQYGENPEHIATIVAAEIQGLEDAGFASCTKHWIGRGGDDGGFDKAASIAQNWENWMVGWKAALGAGAEWVMTNCDGKGFAHQCDPKWDSETMGYLRNELGFNGVVVTDWWALRATQYDGVTDLEGNVLKDQSFEWLHARAIQLGTDVFGNGQISHATDHDEILSTGNLGNYPDVVAKAYTDGVFAELDAEDEYHESTARILRFKFKKGLFENPYRVTEESMAIIASAEYQAQLWEIT